MQRKCEVHVDVVQNYVSKMVILTEIIALSYLFFEKALNAESWLFAGHLC